MTVANGRRLRSSAVVALLAAGLLSACTGTDRPEGVVERWLLALNVGSSGQPQFYAPAALSEQMLPGWASKDPGQLDVIEVGRGVTVEGGTAVPYRAKVLNGPDRSGVAIVASTRDGLRITGLEPARTDLRVPSQGGPSIVAPSTALWLLALGLALGLSLVTVALMQLFGGPKPA